jgi:carbamoyl-phosphate synthase large subunit
MGAVTAIVLTGVGKRYDIVSAFARHATTVAVDPNPLAPARYATPHRRDAPRFDDPGYVPALREICEEFGAGAVLPLTDLDIEVLAEARARGELPALVADADVARATFDKLECHALLRRHDLPSPGTAMPEDLDAVGGFPVVVKPRRGSGSRAIHRADDPEQVAFFARYAGEPVVVQRQLRGEHVSLDCLGDLDGRCLNVIPRSMLESRGGELVKGEILADRELIELGRRAMEALRVRGPGMFQVFRDPELGLGIHDVNLRFGGGFPGLMYGALDGRTYPELVVRMARGERVAPHVGELRAGRTFLRFYWQLELDEELRPTGRDIVDPPGPPPPYSGAM